MAASDCLASSVASGSVTSLMAVDSTKLLSRLLTKDDVAGVISELDSVANAVEGACAGLMRLISWWNLFHPALLQLDIFFMSSLSCVASIPSPFAPDRAVDPSALPACGATVYAPVVSLAVPRLQWAACPPWTSSRLPFPRRAMWPPWHPPVADLALSMSLPRPLPALTCVANARMAVHRVSAVI